jgi:uncharacterized small protein (DUF1192 family)
MGSRSSRHYDGDRPPSAGDLDPKILRLGGGATSAILLRELPEKTPTSLEARIIELREEIGRLHSEVAYYSALTEEALLRVLPLVHFHVQGLYEALRRCDEQLEDIPRSPS